MGRVGHGVEAAPVGAIGRRRRLVACGRLNQYGDYNERQAKESIEEVSWLGLQAMIKPIDVT